MTTSVKSDIPQGTLDLLILRVAALGPIHGYAIAQRLQQVVDTLPADWQVAAIGWIAGSEHLPFAHITEHWQRHHAGDIWGTGAYLVNGAQGAAAILDCITPIRSHIDRMFWESVRDGRLKGYFLREPLAWQRTDMASQNV